MAMGLVAPFAATSGDLVSLGPRTFSVFKFAEIVEELVLGPGSSPNNRA